MWILVVGPLSLTERSDGAISCLRDLGCKVQHLDLWDSLEPVLKQPNPPTAIVVECLEQVDAGKAALTRLAAEPKLAEVPVLAAVSLNALQRLGVADGFDDFVLVPYVPMELYTRLRRVEWRRSEFSSAAMFKQGSLCIDFAAHEVTVDDRAVDLTQQEFALLRFLCENRSRVFSREQLLSRVWGVNHYGGSRTVDIHVRRVRMKLGAAADCLQTVRGVGYKVR